jgi:hypothetical protein
MVLQCAVSSFLVSLGWGTSILKFQRALQTTSAATVQNLATIFACRTKLVKVVGALRLRTKKILFRSLSFWQFRDSLNAVLCFLGRDGSRTRNSAYWILTLENCCSFHDVLDVHDVQVVHDD